MSALSYDIKLIVGLGNPGPKYSETRHNAGFWFVEDLASQYRSRFLPEKKFHGEVARINLEGKDIWLLKPETYVIGIFTFVYFLLEFHELLSSP